MRKWRREGGNGDRYREEKGSYKKLCEDKKNSKNEKKKYGRKTKESQV